MPADPFGTPESPYLYPVAQSDVSCSRMLNDIAPPVCGKPPELHILWEFRDLDVQSGLCAAHSHELAELDFAQAHPMGPACGIDAAFWDIERNCCVLSGKTDGVTVDEGIETPLTTVGRPQGSPSPSPIFGFVG